ncbi:DUF3592 domain-containing protein [Stieleria varia]|uniref:Uncharacterized protein n=1 Tax=Stieleria varia TaxID=2528005 RepID=A0A5C6AT01_9BACT|nr:DUF3592 domain-containing protein [Stieleria varia]TWU02678.1 hypothetical protein Pla52n_37360 [Stieleria varia]
MPNHSDLANDLSDLFAQNVHVNDLKQRSVDDVSILIINVSYLQSDSSPMKTVRQTIVFLHDDQINLPQFALWPHFTGITGKIFTSLSRMVDLDFDDSPEFSRAYHLFAWNEVAVRKLFTHGLRNRLSADSRWSMRAKGNRIAIFFQNELIEPEQMASFVTDATRILKLVLAGEAELDEHPEIRRDSNLQDLASTASKMGGIQGYAIQQTIKKYAVTGDEIDAFLETSTPRTEIPVGLWRQVAGDNFALILLGIFFVILAIIVPLVVVAFSDARDRWLAIPFAVLFPLIGGLILFLTLRHNRRKNRLLRNGTLVSGTITDVRRTSTEVNGAARYHVTMKYDWVGKEVSIRENLYSGIEKAQTMQESGDPIRLLVDPDDPKQVICIDLLLVTSPNPLA